jgi:hypothetical protein
VQLAASATKSSPKPDAKQGYRLHLIIEALAARDLRTAGKCTSAQISDHLKQDVAEGASARSSCFARCPAILKHTSQSIIGRAPKFPELLESSTACLHEHGNTERYPPRVLLSNVRAAVWEVKNATGKRRSCDRKQGAAAGI